MGMDLSQYKYIIHFFAARPCSQGPRFRIRRKKEDMERRAWLLLLQLRPEFSVFLNMNVPSVRNNSDKTIDMWTMVLMYKYRERYRV